MKRSQQEIRSVGIAVYQPIRNGFTCLFLRSDSDQTRAYSYSFSFYPFALISLTSVTVVAFRSFFFSHKNPSLFLKRETNVNSEGIPIVVA